MRIDTIPAQSSASRPEWRTMVMALIMLTGAFSIAGLALPAAAHASTMAVDQCNGHGPAAEGATTAMKCTVTVINTMSGTSTYSTTTVTRLCTLGPCSTPNGTFTTSSISLVTVIQQCNNSDNDAAHAISCNVNVTNNIGRNTPGAQPVTAATVNQCVGSATGGVVSCGPSPATATGATVTQCNGSGNGGGGTVHCTVDGRSTVSHAIPITVNQCNGTGNVGGSAVTCKASIITKITHAAAAIATATPTRTMKATPTRTTTATPSQTSQAPSGQVRTGAESAAGSDHSGLLMLGAGLVLVTAVGALLYRRYGGTELFRRYSGRALFRRFTRKD
jgi:hypothetical protein